MASPPSTLVDLKIELSVGSTIAHTSYTVLDMTMKASANCFNGQKVILLSE